MNAIIVTEASTEEVAALALAAQGRAVPVDAVVAEIVSHLSEAAGDTSRSSTS